MFDLQGACGDCEQVVESSGSGLILKMNVFELNCLRWGKWHFLTKK